MRKLTEADTGKSAGGGGVDAAYRGLLGRTVVSSRDEHTEYSEACSPPGSLQRPQVLLALSLIFSPSAVGD